MSQNSSRRYGYYRCSCGRTWRSAYTWCDYHTMEPNHAQDCSHCHQSVFAYRVEYLKVPKKDELRNDDLTKNHVQELCHRCRNKPYPCSNNIAFTNRYKPDNDFNHYLNTDDDEDDDDDDDEDDDLSIAIRNSLLDNNHNENDIITVDSDEESIFDEPQTAVELTQCIQTQFTQTQPQTPYICNRSKKRSRLEMESNEIETIKTPFSKKRRIETIKTPLYTIKSICIKYGWNEISAVNMLSFKRGKERLNVWVKNGGLLSMRIQPMNYGRTDISLESFEERLSQINTKQSKPTQTNGFIMTQEMRDRMEANRIAALERRRKTQEAQSIQIKTETKLTQQQKQEIDRKREAAIKRRAVWRQQQSQLTIS